MKKFISLLLCTTLLISLFCINVNAAEAEELTVPRVYVTTDDGNGNTIEKADGYVGANVKIEDVDGSVLEDKASFKVRGNSTALAEKKPFTFKFSKKKDVLGMGKGKKWALLANCFDPTLMRNYIAFDIAHELGIDYTSNQKYVELWVDGVFKGCYTLMEPVQQGKDRVDIDIESNNGMKDFLIEYEYNREEEGVTYIKSNGYRFALSEPEEPTAEQLEYIQEKVDIMTAAMVSKNYDRITEVVDIVSFAKLYLLNEFVKNVDSNYSSVFYYYKDGTFYAGPPWDYDLASGNPNPTSSSSYLHASTPDRLYTAYTNFFYHLMTRNEFRLEVRKVYEEHYDYFCDIYSGGGLMDGLLTKYGEVFRRNFDEAGWDVGKRYTVQQRQPKPTYEENVSFLRDWYSRHNAWLGNTLYVYGVNVREIGQGENPRRLEFSIDIKNESTVNDFSVELTASEPMYFSRTLSSSDAVRMNRYTSRKNYIYAVDLPDWIVPEEINIRLVVPDVKRGLEPQYFTLEIPENEGDEVLRVGDADHDGEITVDDATEVQKICADIITADGRTKAAADINGDGVIDVTEATKIQQNLAEIFTDGYTRNIGKTFRFSVS